MVYGKGCELLSKILSLTIEHNWFFVIGCVLVFYRWFQKNKKSGRNTGKWCLRYSFSEQFKLNIIGRWFLNLFFVKKFHWAELFICNWQNAHLAFGWKKRFYATDMHLGVFCTWTMTHIDGKLKHYEPVWNQPFPEVGILLPLFLCISRKIEENEYPHNSIFAESVH